MGDEHAPTDDETIPDGTELWRRIPIWTLVADPNIAGGFRPSSDAFDDPELSVVLADECTGGMDTLLRNHEDFGVASFSVGEVREFGWGVMRIPDPELPGHAHVLGPKTKSQRSKLAKKCRMLRTPRQPGLTS